MFVARSDINPFSSAIWTSPLGACTAGTGTTTLGLGGAWLVVAWLGLACINSVSPATVLMPPLTTCEFALANCVWGWSVMKIEWVLALEVDGTGFFFGAGAGANCGLVTRTFGRPADTLRLCTWMRGGASCISGDRIGDKRAPCCVIDRDCVCSVALPGSGAVSIAGETGCDAGAIAVLGALGFDPAIAWPDRPTFLLGRIQCCVAWDAASVPPAC